MLPTSHLAATGYKRQVAIHVSYFEATIGSVQGTKLIATVPRRFIDGKQPIPSIRILKPPKQETAKAAPNEVVSPDAFIFPNSRRGFMDTGNYRNRVLKPLAERLEIPKLNFQILRRTMATRAQSMGSVKDIQAHLRRAKADTTANEYMRELPEREEDGRRGVRHVHEGRGVAREFGASATKSRKPLEELAVSI